MKLAPEMVSAAFAQHFAIYAANDVWGVPHHVDMWNWARQAFVHHDSDAFEKVYEELRKRWQVFRGKRARPSPDELQTLLAELDSRFAKQSLSSLRREDALPLWKVIKAMAGIKPLNDGPSMMAISKFLHFWNPRLFVIVDMAMMWNWVFEHGWIWDPIKAIQAALQTSLPPEIRNDADYQSNLGWYLTILLWCGELTKANPCIATGFDDYIRNKAGSASPRIPPDLNTYEAAAVEWFLLGAVELPPSGIIV